MPEKLVVICGIDQRSLKQFLTTVHGLIEASALQMVSRLTHKHELRQWTGEP